MCNQSVLFYQANEGQCEPRNSWFFYKGKALLLLDDVLCFQGQGLGSTV